MKLCIAFVVLAGLSVGLPAVAQAPESGPPAVDAISWVNPPDSLPAGVSHHTFQSRALGR